MIGALCGLGTTIAQSARPYKHTAKLWYHGLVIEKSPDCCSDAHPFTTSADRVCRVSTVAYVYAPTGEHSFARRQLACHNHIYTDLPWHQTKAHITSRQTGLPHHAHPSP